MRGHRFAQDANVMQMRHFAALALHQLRQQRVRMPGGTFRDWRDGNINGATLMLVALGPWVGSNYDALRDGAMRLKEAK